MEEASKRLVDQRIRNRVIECLESLAEWQETLRTFGYVDYFESFFDWFPYEGAPHPNDTMTADEQAAVARVHRLMIEALNATPRRMTEDQFTATGWPQRISPAAEQALSLMLERGRFSEEQEELTPSRGR
jgi:hypothetical protein